MHNYFVKSIGSSHYFIKSITSSRCVEDTPGDTLVHTLVHDNTRPLVWCLKISDQNLKEFCVILRISSSRLVYYSSIQCPIFECVWFCNVTPDLYRENVTQQTSR